jgi:hypothetical protein
MEYLISVYFFVAKNRMCLYVYSSYASFIAIMKLYK